MKLFEQFKKKWSAMSAAEKCKYVICVVCDIGGSFLGGVLAEKLVDEDAGRIKKFTMKTTLLGLGMTASTLASNEFNAMVDAVLPEKKEEETEDDA
jgi:hypothetical protein